MKKILLTIAIAFMAGTASAQGFRVGIKAGVNSSNVYDTKGEDFEADPKLGFVGGAFVSIPIGKFIGVQPEVLWSKKGFTGTGSILGSPYHVKRTSTFVDVPILFAVKPISFFTILAGPQYSYLMRQRDVFKSETTTIEQEQEFENENIRRNMLCFLGGVDFNVARFVLSTRAGWDILNNNGDGTTSTPRYKYVWYQATVGMKF